jgi:hypothetical protein
VAQSKFTLYKKHSAGLKAPLDDERFKRLRGTALMQKAAVEPALGETPVAAGACGRIVSCCW